MMTTMQTFDEPKLIAELGQLPAALRVVFAACCAERLIPAYRAFEAQNGRATPNALERALEEVWADPEPLHDPEALEGWIEDLMPLIPAEENIQPWSQEATNAQEAAIAAMYAVRARVAAEPQEAAWAARHAYDAIDNHVINREDIDTNEPGGEQRVVAHPLMQAELARQRRDLDELRAAPTDVAAVVARLRDRARAEAADFFGTLV